MTPYRRTFLPFLTTKFFTNCIACRSRTATHLTGSHRWNLVGDVINKIKIKIRFWRSGKYIKQILFSSNYAI